MPPPAELIAGPIDLWIQDAAASVTHPEISDPPPVVWVKLGSNISEDGVTFSRSESIEKRKTLDSPLTKKLFRTEYDVELSLNLQDMSIATLARIENGATVATTAAGSGTGGFNEYTGGRGFDIKYYSLLIRGTSPFDNGMTLQMLALYTHIMAGDTGPFDKSDVGTDVMVYLVQDSALTNGYYTWREQNAAAA